MGDYCLWRCARGFLARISHDSTAAKGAPAGAACSGSGAVLSVPAYLRQMCDPRVHCSNPFVRRHSQQPRGVASRARAGVRYGGRHSATTPRRASAVVPVVCIACELWLWRRRRQSRRPRRRRVGQARTPGPGVFGARRSGAAMPQAGHAFIAAPHAASRAGRRMGCAEPVGRRAARRVGAERRLQWSARARRACRAAGTERHACPQVCMSMTQHDGASALGG